MKILVFGKDGQLGRAFQALFNSINQTSIVSLDVQFIGRNECDLGSESSLDELLNQSKPNLIINASAYTAVDKAESEIDLTFAINAKAPEVMARFAAKNQATFLHYSTDYVFDGEKYGFYLEGDLRNPLGVYGKSKAAGEEAIAQAFATSTDGQYAILRTSWVFGDGGNFIRTILRLAKERSELKIIHDQYGVPTSADWLAMVSLALVLDGQLQLKLFSSGIYHAVPQGETTWYGLACLAVQSALDEGVDLKAKLEGIEPISADQYPLPAPRPMNSRMSTDKLYKAFESEGDVSKLDLLKRPWDDDVRAYVAQLVRNKLI